jgi:sulfur carrier protein
MRIELNGEGVELPEGASVADAATAAGADPDARGVAVALDGEVVPRGELAGTALRDGQRVEVVAAVAAHRAPPPIAATRGARTRSSSAAAPGAPV